jgi:hypothetical protein
MIKNHRDSAAQEKNLSLEAIGLYALIKSCIEDPEFDYDHFKSAVMAKCKENCDAFDSTWNELIKAGYLKQRGISHGETESKEFHDEYELLEVPSAQLVTCARTE